MWGASVYVPLEVSVEVDLDDTVADSLLELLLGAARATVEDKEDGLVVRRANGVLDVLLVLGEQLGVELDVAGLVDTVDVAEASGNGEEGGDGGEPLVDHEDVLGLGVEGVVVNILVVDTVLLTTGDTDLHLEELLHGGHALEVLGGGGDVVLDVLLGQIDHVRGPEGLAGLLEPGLIGIEHAVQPGQELLGAVVGVEDDGNAVGRGNGADVVSRGNSTVDGGELILVVDALAGEVGSTTLRGLQDDGRLGVAGSLESTNDSRGAGDVLRAVSQWPAGVEGLHLRWRGWRTCAPGRT